MFFTNPESMNLFHEILGYIFRGLQGGFFCYDQQLDDHFFYLDRNFYP